MQALLSPKVWMIGLYFFFALTCSYAFSFSAPSILQQVTGWSVANVGFLVACFGLAGAAGMVLNGEHSDVTGERPLHCIVPCGIMAVGYVTASYAHMSWLVVASLGASFIAYNSQLGPAVAIPTQFLAGRAAAAGIAAMNTITMFSGFVGPLLDGPDEGCDRQRQSGPARFADTLSGRSSHDGDSDTEPAAKPGCRRRRDGI